MQHLWRGDHKENQGYTKVCQNFESHCKKTSATRYRKTHVNGQFERRKIAAAEFLFPVQRVIYEPGVYRELIQSVCIVFRWVNPELPWQYRIEAHKLGFTNNLIVSVTGWEEWHYREHYDASGIVLGVHKRHATKTA